MLHLFLLSELLFGSCFLFGLINRMIGYVIMAVMAVGSAMLLYQDYMTVKRDVDYNTQYDEMDLEIKARMGDIKAAEVAYKDFYEHYTNDFDSLIYFVKHGSKKGLVSKGTLPERSITPEERDYIYHDNRPIDKLMTEEEAHCLAHSPNPPSDLIGFARDTVLKPVLESVFQTERYLETRSKISENLIPFHPDSLPHVPYSSLMATLDTGSVMKGEITVPTLMIKMGHPMDSAKWYIIGDVNDNNLRDNWTK